MSTADKVILDQYFDEYDFHADRDEIATKIEHIAAVERVPYKDLYREWELQALGFPLLRDLPQSKHFQWLLRQDNTTY